MRTRSAPFKRILFELAVVLVMTFVFLAASFLAYYALFSVMEYAFNEGRSYWFVSIIRLGIGVALLGGFFLVDRGTANDRVKSSLFACALSVTLIGLGVQLYERPALFYIIASLLYALCLSILYRRRRRWPYYYALVLAALASILYL